MSKQNLVSLGGSRLVPKGTKALRLHTHSTWTFDEVTILMGTDNKDFVTIDAPKVGKTVAMSAYLFPMESKAAIEAICAKRETARKALIAVEAEIYGVKRFPFADDKS